MSRSCDICGKSPMYGNKVSKTYNHTKRTWRPNILKVKVDFGNGGARTINVCARCLRSDFITKKVHVPKETPAATN